MNPQKKQVKNVIPQQKKSNKELELEKLFKQQDKLFKIIGCQVMVIDIETKTLHRFMKTLDSVVDEISKVKKQLLSSKQK